MKKTLFRNIIRVLLIPALCLGVLIMHTGCKLFSLWQGDETVTVAFGDKTVTVSLQDMIARTYEGAPGVLLSNIVLKAKIAPAADLVNYTFNFVSSDGVNMSSGLAADMSLPSWADIQKGYVYDAGDTGGLSVEWDPSTGPGADTGNYYKVTLLAGGAIQIVETGAPANPWTGDEQVIVEFGANTVTVNLSDLNISTYEGIEGVRLSDIAKKANLAPAADLENYFYNFIGSDGFDMSGKAQSQGKSLPIWTDMENGYLYDSGSSSGLCVKWENGTAPGDFGKFYNAKLMDGGTIQIREENVL